MNVLNEPRSALDVSLDLQKLMLRMKGEFMNDDGRSVDYARLQTSDLFQMYLSRSKELRDVDITALNEGQRKAFFINVYNALTLHGLAVCQTPPTSVLNIKDFWSTTSYFIGGHTYSLDDIEHGVLRGNRPHPSSPNPLFQIGDPRLASVIKTVDPRIHFSLVCGAKSCPAINVYSERNLDYALNAATRNFVHQEVCVDMDAKKVTLSKILQWYGVDFGATQREVVEWLVPYLSNECQTNVTSLLEVTKDDDSLNVTYSDYNWNLNKS